MPPRLDARGPTLATVHEIEKIIRQVFDLSPGGIIEALSLRRPSYRQTAAYGHFGRADLDLPWEHLDRVEELQAKMPRQMA